MGRRELARLDSLSWVYRIFSGLFAFFGLWVWLPNIRHALVGGSWQLAGCSLVYGVFALLWAAGLFLAAYRLRERRQYGLCLGMAASLLIFFPFGTAAGVWSLSLLRRPAVKALFES